LKILSEFIQTNFAFGSIILIVGKHSRTVKGFRRDYKVFTRMDGGLPRLFRLYPNFKDFSRLCKPSKNKMTMKNTLFSS